MKRSEMVKQIAIELLDIFEKNYMEEKGEGWCANLILLRLEDFGMQPPEIKEFVEIPPHNILGAGFKVGHNVNKWEKEDV